MNISITNSAASAVNTGAKPSPITAAVVASDHRLDFLPKHFGSLFLVGEFAVYDAMKELCPAYSGGFWDFVELSNGGFYMRLSTPSESPSSLAISVGAGNDYAGAMSVDAASIVATLFALNRLAFDGHDDMGDKFYLLRDFAKHHPERREIFQAID